MKAANGQTVEQLAAGGAESAVTKNGQIGVSTAGAIRRAGGRITPDRPTNPRNPFHCEICGLTGSELEGIFQQQANPLRLP